MKSLAEAMSIGKSFTCNTATGRLHREVLKLQRIVETLPKSADHVRIGLGMTFWINSHVKGVGFYRDTVLAVRSCCPEVTFSGGQCPELRDVYFELPSGVEHSEPEAAEQAGENPGGGTP